MSKATLNKARKLRDELSQMKAGAPADLLMSIEAQLLELSALVRRLEAKQYYKQQEIRVPKKGVHTPSIKSISITATVVFGD